MDAFLDHWAPRILRWAGRLLMAVSSALVAVCVIGFATSHEPMWLVLAVGDAFLVFIGWHLADEEAPT